MTAEIIAQILLLGLALSMDAFAVSITDGLIYVDLNKKKAFFIAGVFGLMQGLMPLIGYFLVELVVLIVGEASAGSAGTIMAKIVTWTAFSLLLFIGGKMLFEGIASLRKTEAREPKSFSYKEVLLFGIATSIDALAVGVSLHSGLSDNITIFLHAGIIILITFVICIFGVLLGHQIEKLLKGKISITSIIGGSILIALAIWILVSHYTGL